MIPGFNSDVEYRGFKYHIQSEDWGFDRPYLVTQIFSRGAVIRTFKTPYDPTWTPGSLGLQQAISWSLKQQHEMMVREISSGIISLA
ncbi:MAG: hypothetical protein V4736_16430 [Bdellovibrionota bacterium]